LHSNEKVSMFALSNGKSDKQILEMKS